MSDELSDQMAEAFRRQREHGERAAQVDRRGWTQEQWADDAERLMHDIDGAITSLVNGHVNALIRERRDLRAALAAQPQALFEGRFDDACRWLNQPGRNVEQRVVVYPAPAGSATPTAEWVTPAEDMWQDDDEAVPAAPIPEDPE